MTRINALFRYDCIDYTHFSISLYVYRTFPFLWDQFQRPEANLIFVARIRLIIGIFGLENDNCESTQLLDRVFGPPFEWPVSSCKIGTQHYFRCHHALTVETIPCSDICRSCHVKFQLLILTSYYELDPSASVLSRHVFQLLFLPPFLLYVVKDDFLNNNKRKVVYWIVKSQGDSSLTL
jgi:hypothetical protein